MSKLFNVNMSSNEAMLALHAACDGKTQEERELLLKEYFPIADKIIDRELALAAEGWLLG